MDKKIVLATVMNAVFGTILVCCFFRQFSGLPTGLLPWFGLTLALGILSALCWAPLVRKLTRGFAQLEKITTKLAEGQLEERIPSTEADEFGRSINRMAERFEGIVKQQKRFLGDVAHELNAPIARIQFALGLLEETLDDEQQGDVKK